MKTNIILDCDGVLYPLFALPTQKFVDAMKDVYRKELKLSGEQQRQISQKTIQEEHLGMFNYIREMCYATGYDFDCFCKQMSERIDYTNINPNPNLWNVLKQLKEKNNIVIWSNGCRAHLDEVFKRLFNKNITDVEKNGIRVFDIKSMERGGYFEPKQSKNGFAMFLQKTGFRADDCILFDDTPRNLIQAKLHGVKGVLISDDKPLLQALQSNFPTLRPLVKTYE